MIERDLLLRELAIVNAEYKPAGIDNFLDVSLNNKPSAIIEQAAVRPFSQDDRTSLYAAVLPLKPSFISKTINSKKVKLELPSIEGATKKNAKTSGKILGVDIPVFLDRLKKYVDLPTIEQALVKSYPTLVIDKANSLNEIITEAVHQFQAKVFIDKASWDGIIGPSVLSSMGFVFHEKQNVYVFKGK